MEWMGSFLNQKDVREAKSVFNPQSLFGVRVHVGYAGVASGPTVGVFPSSGNLKKSFKLVLDFELMLSSFFVLGSLVRNLPSFFCQGEASSYFKYSGCQCRGEVGALKCLRASGDYPGRATLVIGGSSS